MDNSLTKFWKCFFLLAGLFNCCAGGLGMGFPSLGLKVTTGLATAESGALLIFFLLSTVVALFGLGYIMVAFNAAGNRGLVIVGCIGKLCFFATALFGYLNGNATMTFFVLTIGDFLWAVLFLSYLISSDRAAKRIYV